jgi:redox-sensitive bicupin YhaK (pirin superfamily)
MSLPPVKPLIKSKATLEGAGGSCVARLPSGFDPFLLLHDFRNDVPADCLLGPPQHPHRGNETITYVLAGTVEARQHGRHGAMASGDAMDDCRKRHQSPANAQA